VEAFSKILEEDEKQNRVNTPGKKLKKALRLSRQEGSSERRKYYLTSNQSGGWATGLRSRAVSIRRSEVNGLNMRKVKCVEEE